MPHPSVDARILKQHIRKNIRAKLLSLTAEEIRYQSEQVFMKFFDLPEYKNAKSIGLFLSMPKGEIVTSDACRRVLQDNKRLFVPRVGIHFEHDEMDLIRVEEENCTRPFYERWPRNRWGIPEPPSLLDVAATEGDLDLIVVPGCGFDRFGGRLGQGKGYYDKFIHRLRPSELELSFPLLVGVALEPSFISDEGINITLNDENRIIDSIPMLQHDIHMNMIITPSNVFRVRDC